MVQGFLNTSQVGYSGPGILKYNQDNFFIYKNLNDESNVLFIGVCDGHGLVGHDVSKYLITNLPNNLNTALKKTNKYISHKETLYSTLKQVFVDTNKSLCKVPTIDTKFSGSTCVTIILTKNKIISANAGDSRAVMGRHINGKWLSIELSHDQNPTIRSRIILVKKKEYYHMVEELKRIRMKMGVISVRREFGLNMKMFLDWL